MNNEWAAIARDCGDGVLKIAVVSNQTKDKEGQYLRQLGRAAQGKAALLLDEAYRGAIDGADVFYGAQADLYQEADLLIVLGGDGTLLNAARQVAHLNLPIAGVNLGRMGYLTAIERHEVDGLIDRLIDGSYIEESRMMLEAEVDCGCKGQPACPILALNDIVIARLSVSRMIHVEITVNGELLESFTADGVVAATPTGSTAYSLSAGGPVVDPTTELILVTPICPHDLASRAVLLPADKQVEISLGKAGMQDAMITVDGQEGHTFECGDRLIVRRSKYNIRLIRTGDMSFYRLLRRKLREGRSDNA